MRNFAFGIMEKAFAQPDNVAFDGGGGLVRYQRFADLVVHFARRMQEFGVNDRSRLSLAIQSPMVSCIAVTALSLLGASWRRYERDVAWVDSLLPTTHSFAGMKNGGQGAFEFTRAWFEAPASSLADMEQFAGNAEQEDIWFYAMSSGTTGRQKCIPISYRSAWVRIMEVPDLRDVVPPVLYSMFDGSSYVGLRPRLTVLAAGGTNITNVRWRQMQESGVTRVLASPAQLGAVLTKALEPARKLLSCRLTGAQVTRKFLELALRHFEQVEVLYGSTEAGIMTLAEFTDSAQFDGSVGRPSGDTTIEVVHTDGTPTAIGVAGEIRVQTPGIFGGYFNEPELSAEVFRDGWFHPGDLGHVDASGALHLSGRTSDVINVGGVKLNAGELDELIQLHPDVADGYCFIERTEGGFDRLAAIVSVREGVDANRLQGLRAFATDKLSSASLLKHLYVAHDVPRNENGKPRRGDAAELVRDLPVIEFG